MCLFDGFELDGRQTRVCIVVGSNGSGKTSMLNILCGSIPVDGGQILMNGKDITNKKNLRETEDWTCISEPIYGNLPVYDHSGRICLLQIIKENSLDSVQESIRRVESTTGKS